MDQSKLSLRESASRKCTMMLVFLLLLVICAVSCRAQASINFVQVNANDPPGTQTPSSASSVTATYSSAHAAGDLNIVVVGWCDTANTVTSLSDTKGNAYSLAVSYAPSALGITNSIYYASNIVTASAGANTVTVKFSGSVCYPDLRILEYSGVSTLDKTGSAGGTSTTANSGSVTTTSANELLFGANYTFQITNGAGSGYTSRMITSNGDVVEDRIVSSAGTYNATAAVQSGNWVMQIATFSPATHWSPNIGVRHQFQLQGVSAYCNTTGGYNTNVSGMNFNGTTVTPDVYAIDLYADSGICTNIPAGTLNSAAVNALHAAGKKAICYVDIGTAEPYRPDYQDFVNFDSQCGHCLLGKPDDSNDPFLNLNNDKGQRTWLFTEEDKRLAKCQHAGFDGVYFDVGWAWQLSQSTTGWNISASTQLAYNQGMLNLAHNHNLGAGINYDLLQVSSLVPYEDFHVDESCFQYSECNYLLPVVQANKPVLEIEYSTTPSADCPQEPGTYNWNTEFKQPTLYDYPWQTCR